MGMVRGYIQHRRPSAANCWHLHRNQCCPTTASAHRRPASCGYDNAAKPHVADIVHLLSSGKKASRGRPCWWPPRFLFVSLCLFCGLLAADRRLETKLLLPWTLRRPKLIIFCFSFGVGSRLTRNALRAPDTFFPWGSSFLQRLVRKPLRSTPCHHHVAGRRA